MEREKDHEIQFIDGSCKEMLIFNEKIEERIKKLDKRGNAIDKIGNIVCNSMNIIYMACIRFMPFGKELFDSPPVISFLFWHFYYYCTVQIYLWDLLSKTKGRLYKHQYERTSSYSKLYPEELRRFMAILLPYIFISFTYGFSDAWRNYYNNIQGIPIVIGWSSENPQSFTVVPSMNRLRLHLLLSFANVFLLVLTFSLRRYKVWLVEKIMQERAQIRERKDLV
jgi:hypothetical protein